MEDLSVINPRKGQENESCRGWRTIVTAGANLEGERKRRSVSDMNG